MGSFSWNRADKLGKYENIYGGCAFKFLVPRSSAGLSATIIRITETSDRTRTSIRAPNMTFTRFWRFGITRL